MLDLRTQRRRLGVSQAMHDALTNPPHAVADERELTVGVEMARRLDETEVAFVNEIQEGHAELAIASRVGHHEPQVACDERVECRAVLLLNASSEFVFLFDRETGEFRDLLKVGLQRCGFRR